MMRSIWIYYPVDGSIENIKIFTTKGRAQSYQTSQSGSYGHIKEVPINEETKRVRISELITKLNKLLTEYGDLEVLDNEFLAPINKVQIVNMARGRSGTRVVIGRDE